MLKSAAEEWCNVQLLLVDCFVPNICQVLCILNEHVEEILAYRKINRHDLTKLERCLVGWFNDLLRVSNQMKVADCRQPLDPKPLEELKNRLGLQKVTLERDFRVLT